MYINSKFKLILPLLVIITSFWFWKLVGISLLLAIGLVLLGVFAFSYHLQQKKEKIAAIILMLVLVSVVGFRNSFNNDIFNVTNLEKDVLEKKHEYYAISLGKLYKNRVGIYLAKELSMPVYKFKYNFFANLDPNVYFFAGHPRERQEAIEFKKFSFLWLPLFFVGLFFFFKENKFNTVYFIATAFLSAFADPNSFLGPFLFLPLIAVIISVGINKFLLKK